MSGNCIKNTSRSKSFKSIITGLRPDTKYYVVTYAKNSAGISYSFVDEFITAPDLPYGTVSDIEGNEYRTVKIGNQTWMAENLKSTKYADGTPIPFGNDRLEEFGKFYYIHTYSSNLLRMKEIYGLLYSWEAATRLAPGGSKLNGVQGVCPNGWHIPSYSEITGLITFLGGPLQAGKKLKEAGIAHWHGNPLNASNESGFSALGAGIMFYEEDLYPVFDNFQNWTAFWTSESYKAEVSYGTGFIALDYDVSGNINAHNSRPPLIHWGLSVRCIKDHKNSFVTIPAIKTLPIENITGNSANAGGEVLFDGGQFYTSRGICWSTSPNPDTLSLRTREIDEKPVFRHEMNGLIPGTTYYVRAYATNRAGVNYGNELSFTTASNPIVRSKSKGEYNALNSSVVFDFYPNPAYDILHFINLPENATVVVYDSNGKVIINETVINNVLDISSLKDGAYYLKIKDDNSEIKKLIKQ